MAQISTIVTIKKQYQCESCDGIHNHVFDAEECCRPEIHEVYVCPLCKGVSYTEADAINCCDIDPLNLPEIRPTREELERHGQIRLQAI